MTITYRASHVLVDLGWVDLDLGEFPRLVGCHCSYLLPKQAGGMPQILQSLANDGTPTSVLLERYLDYSPKFRSCSIKRVAK